MKYRLLTSILLLSVTFLFAQTAVMPASGNGTPEDPYRISSLENLYWIASDTAHWSANYIQTLNIDASETASWFPDGSGRNYGWPPIGFHQYYFVYNSVSDVWEIAGGDYRPFSGSYDGNGFMISGLYINRDSIITESPDPSPNPQPIGRDSSQYVGMFGILDGAVISNLVCSDFNVTGTEEVGGLAGNAVNSQITHCRIDGTVSASSGVGGLVAYSRGSAIKRCSADVNVNGNLAGGLVGTLVGNDAAASFCCSYGSVSGESMIGGLTGRNDHGSIQNCYSFCSVNGEMYTGGLAGFDDYDSPIVCSYSAGPVSGTDHTGGLVGFEVETGTNTNVYLCLWDTQSSGLLTSAGGSGKTTSEMQDPSTFINAGWDLDTVWTMHPAVNGAYPYLRSTGFPTVYTVRFEVNMSGSNSFDPLADTVRITGSFFDWAVPGTIAEQDMSRIGDSDIWACDLLLEEGTHQYKYFYNSGWGGNEWEGEPNRIVSITCDTLFQNIWGSPTDEAPVHILRTEVPKSFTVYPAYPNPFNPRTVISIHYAVGSHTTVNIYNTQGVLVDRLVNGFVEAGRYELIWDASDMPSGIYLVRVVVDHVVEVQKIALMK